jgi:hypothetical protein
VSEATELVRRCRLALGRLSAAAAALERYAGTLEHTRHTVWALQRDWDRAADEHEHAVAAVRLRLGSDVDAAPMLVRLTEEHEDVRARLSSRHSELQQELDRAALRATTALASLNDEGLPRGASPTPTSLRDRLIHGLPIASGAARASDIGRLAVSDAAAARRLLAHELDAVTPAAVGDLVGTLQRHGGDPLYAQALVEELGVGGVTRLVVVLADARGEVGVDLTRQAVGALGITLLTAVAAHSTVGTGRRDARTARQLESAAALLSDDLVAALGRVVGDDATRSRATGSWLVGQLVVGARQSGWSVPLPPTLLGRLAAGSAAAEIGETRDDDVERLHGTTLRAGGAHFASLFDDADVTGDALHTLLVDAGGDPATVTDLLSTPVGGHGVTNSRGGQLVLAEALARRWVTYEASSPSTSTDLELATNADLARLMAVAGGISEPAAALRARVMSEISRLNSYAQQERSTIATYERNSAGLESAAVDWVLAMPEAIDLTLRRGDPVRGDVWAVPIGSEHQPLLRSDELSALVGAFAVGVDQARTAKTPAADYRGLIDAEVRRATQNERASMPGGHDLHVDALATRIGYFEQSASAALIAVAKRQDAANLSMWRSLAEARALAIAWREGPRALGAAVATLVTGGTNRTPEDDLAISLLRSHVELDQTTVDEQRTAALAASLDALRSEALRQAVATAVLFTAGAQRAPVLATSGELAAARQQERHDALALVVQDGATPRPEALASRVPDPEAHELYTAERLRRAGFTVDFLPRSDDAKSPDAVVGGESWEFKAPFGSGSGTITQAVRFAREQSPRIIIDLARSPLRLEEAVRQVDVALRRYDRIDVVLIITRDGEILERRP